MAFRHSIIGFKKLSYGISEELRPILSGISVQKLRLSSVWPKSKPVTNMCWYAYIHTRNSQKGLKSNDRLNSHWHDCTAVNYVTTNTVKQIIQSNIKGKNSTLSNIDILNSLPNSFKGRFSWSTLKPGFHQHSHQRSTFSISRNFTTIGTNVFQTLTVIPEVKCFRMKHSIPKVPPTRMMRLYDFERTIPDEEAAKEFVFALNASERKCLYEELARFHGEDAAAAASEKPTRQQLNQVMLHQALPFIGFGFLDNFLMIVAGEYIDVTLGAAFGISTMAAAALGNLISDVAGLGSAHYVERFASKVGVKNPHLSPAQVDMNSTKWASNFGKAIGVTIGCLLGMFPLLFFKDDETKKQRSEGKKS